MILQETHYTVSPAELAAGVVNFSLCGFLTRQVKHLVVANSAKSSIS